MKFIALLISTWLLLSAGHATANVNDYLESIHNNPQALYDFFKAMPKGGELHYHLAGGAYPQRLLALAATEPYCIDTKTFAVSQQNPCNGIKSSLAFNDPILSKKIIQAWSMDAFTAGKESSHDHFFAVFSKIMPLIDHFQAQILADSMQKASSQHELYLEIMILPDEANSARFASLISTTTNLADKKNRLLANQAFQNNIQLTQQTSQQLLTDARHLLDCDNPLTGNQAACQVTVTFQYYVLREQSPDQVFAQALNGFAAAETPGSLVGINLVQPEDGSLSLKNYRQEMAIFNFMHKSYPNVHISLHAGELSAEFSAKKDRLFHIHDAIIMGHAERVGHGVDILEETNFKALMNYMANKPIPIEINLSSNEKILNIKGAAHPINRYLDNHVPIVLSTDDEGILGADLSEQYVIAYTQHGIPYETLKQINRNTLSYSFYPGKSLWKNPKKPIPISRCQPLFTKKCDNFVSKNPKAKLQRDLEKALSLFEEKYSS